jgi:acetyltransferase-like isoleucine patch superfamily enzyme
MNTFQCISSDVRLGRDVQLSNFINLYGCEIGDGTKVGAFVEIQKNSTVGKCCIGHGVTFVNDRYPRAITVEGKLQTEADWKVERTVISKGASIGSGTTILSNINIGENVIVGAGSVVTKDVPPNVIVAGNPARVLRHIEESKKEYDGHS